MEGAERDPKIFILQFMGPVDMDGANSYIALSDGLGEVVTVAGLSPMLLHECI
jgi:hypothetical protein